MCRLIQKNCNSNQYTIMTYFQKPQGPHPSDAVMQFVTWGVRIEDDEAPNECDKCGSQSFKYSTEICEKLGDGYYCCECIKKIN